MASLSVSLKPKLLVRLDEFAEKYGYTKSRIAEEAITKYLTEMEEDKADAHRAEEAWKAFEESGEKAIPATEVYEALGL
ncbi:MAG TPA: hypothetical protein VJ861_05130 [Treponemataceae bacterium]|nr:hypothetical protein [Treponemataceae bacterium]